MEIERKDEHERRNRRREHFLLAYQSVRCQTKPLGSIPNVDL